MRNVVTFYSLLFFVCASSINSSNERKKKSNACSTAYFSMIYMERGRDNDQIL